VLLPVLLLAFTPGRPLFYWGARPPVIATEAEADRGPEARIVEVHAALDRGDLVLRLTLDRPVQEALYLPTGEPVSGRLRAVLYLDADGDRATGLDQGPRDLRTGADYRLEVGVVALGEDKDEKLPAQALVTAFLASLAPDGRRRSLWRGDDAATPDRVSVRGEWVELRLPGALVPLRPGARLILTDGERSWDGRIGP
jgi:hypothetical protein